jgi:cell wall assembly regulator SMI1
MDEKKITRRTALCIAGALFTAGCSDGTQRGGSKTEDPTVVSINTSWSRIEAWLSHNAPKIVQNLNAAATAAEIAAAERDLGRQMPGDWRGLYLGHNGMNDNHNFGCLFFGMTFLSLAEAVREHANSNTRGLQPLPVRAADPGIRKADMHNPHWIAFAHDGSDTLLRVDLDPGPGGAAGQVIFTDHADNTVILLAASLSQFLADFAGDLEGGKYFLNKEALQDGDEFLACDQELDIVNWHKSPRWKHLAR